MKMHEDSTIEDLFEGSPNHRGMVMRWVGMLNANLPLMKHSIYHRRLSVHVRYIRGKH